MILFRSVKMSSNDIPSYQHGNPHKLNDKRIPDEIVFDTLPEITLKKEVSVQSIDNNASVKSLPEFIARLKYLASLV
jgi:hypothetical protein